MLDLKKLNKQFTEILNSFTKEDLETWMSEYDEMNPEPPKGWVDFEDFLPTVSADVWLTQGYEEFLVRDSNGKEFIIPVTGDVTVWYNCDVKHLNLISWFNA